MHRFGSLALVASLVTASVCGCTIVTNPPPNQAGTTPAAPGAPATAPPAATPAPANTAAAGPPGPKVSVDGRDHTTLSRPNAFGTGENKPGSFRGFVHFLPATTTQLPNFDTLTPAGVLFTTEFAARSPNFVDGFPGLDAGRVEYFGIRFEGDFVVTAPGDHVFKLESDDGARLSIDSLPLITADGVHLAQLKSGTVKLSPGPHRFRLDYFQAGRGAVALRVTVTSPAAAEKPFGPLL